MTGGGPAEKLFGRDTELEQLDAFVASAAVNGGVLLITGDAGVGKSVLLDATAVRASAQELGCCGLPASSSKRT